MAMITQVNGKTLNTIDSQYATGQAAVPAGLSSADGAQISGIAGNISAAPGVTGGINPNTNVVVPGNTPVGLGDINQLT